MKIFIQIASYRDPQLLQTIKSCLENSRYPENLVFSIARQYHNDDTFDDLSEYYNDDRFKILNIPHEESLGVCWVRNLTQQLYNGEEYTLQIDSHMRFSKDWDITLIEMIQQLKNNGYLKPLLTGYMPSFDPDNDPNSRIQTPWRMVFDRFIPEGAVFFLPEVIPGYLNLTEPIHSRFYSAHFCFTIGDFVKEVQHDPLMYFHGEEISIAARAYTHGYDLFHPHKVVLWHEYTRKNRVKQWDDDPKWTEKNDKSHLRNRKLFSMDGEMYNPAEFGIYGFGNIRTLRDYEIYSGIHFGKRAVQQYTLDKKYPPNPYNFKNVSEWEDSFSRIFKHCIDLHKDFVNFDDYEFWVVAYHDEQDNTIFRQDCGISEIKQLKSSNEEYYKIWREFQTTKQPRKWVVWPYSKSKGWCDKIEKIL
jgi:hypothetical protein